jgi:TM2 domain-containing membrane protein YozV
MNKLIYRNEIFNMVSTLNDTDRQRFMNEFESVEMNPVMLYGWNIWLGMFGVDRFIVGDVLPGVLKLISLGGMGIWQIVDCFLIGNRARTKNLQKAHAIHSRISDRSPTEPLA